MAEVAENPARHPKAKVKGMEEVKVKVLTSLDLNDNKAGMAGLDREKINSIIMEASKGSRFYENEQKKQRQMMARIEEQKAKVKLISPRQVEEGVRQADAFLTSLDASRDLTRTIVHVDMDAFFAAVEMLARPELRDRPMAVGSNYMLSTSNYAARRFGVRAAMPGFIGKKLCPELVILPPNYQHYTEVSRVVRQVFVQYDAHFCPMSLDEAYLDLTDHMATRAALTHARRTYAIPAWDEAYCQCREGSGGHGGKEGQGQGQGSTKVIEESGRLDYSRVGGGTSNSDSIPTDDDKNLNPIFGESRARNSPKVNEAGTKTNESESEGPRMCSECGKPVFAAARPLTRTFGVEVWEAVQEMRFRIYCRTRLTASAGIAPNMMLAKVCSDRNKPNGQYMIPPCAETIREFMKDLPIRKVSGIGKVTESLLSALDVSVCSDLCRQRGLLLHLFSHISYQYFMRVAAGVGATRVESDSERKSMSVERTFGTMSGVSAMLEKCRELSEALAADLRTAQIRGKTVAIKLKTINFEVRTRAQSLPECTMDCDVISRAAESLLRAELKQDPSIELRLMGVRMSNFASASSPTKSSAQTTLTKLFSKKGPEEVAKSSAKSTDPKPEYSLPKGQETACDAKNSNIITSTSMDDVDDDSDDAVYEMDTDVEDFSQPLESDILNADFRFDKKSASSLSKIVELTYGNFERMSVDPTPSTSKPGDSRTIFDAPNITVTSAPNCNEDYTCPICWECINCSNLSGFNNHIDNCLSDRTVVDEYSATTLENGSEVVPKNDKKSPKSPETMVWEKSKSVTTTKKSSKDKQVTIGHSFRFSWSQQTAASGSSSISGSEISGDHVVRRDALENLDKKENESSVNVRNLKSDFFSRKECSESNNVVSHNQSSETSQEEGIVEERIPNAECRRDEGIEERRREELWDRLRCPVCGRVQVLDDLPLFNRHVDMCLQSQGQNKRKSSVSSHRKPVKKKTRR